MDHSLSNVFITGWHPYTYFTGLSYTSNKYHVMLDDHNMFPKWFDTKNKSLNVKIAPKRIIDIIADYIKNGRKLKSKLISLL